jgi:hypothetical protein
MERKFRHNFPFKLECVELVLNKNQSIWYKKINEIPSSKIENLLTKKHGQKYL